MIPRTLVPFGSRPPAADAAPSQRRRPTTLDERTLVPAMLPIVQLDGNSSIPKSLPLESIAARVVVPRDVSVEAYRVKDENALPAQPTDLDERIAIPQGAAPPETIEAPVQPPGDLVDLDVFMTGEVNLLTEPQVVDKDKWKLITRVSSFVFHTLVLIFVLSLPKLFPPHPPTQAELDRANQLLTWIPPESSYAPKPKVEPRPAPQPPVVRVSPKVLNDVAPPPPPTPKPQPEVKRELPDAPAPKIAQVQPDPPPVSPNPKPDPPKAPLKLDSVDMPTPHSALKLPTTTSNSGVDQAVRDLANAPSAHPAITGGGRVQGHSGVPGSRSGGTAFGGLEMLSPTEGLDWTSYLQRVYITVRNNWYAIMPESVELGERGVVVLTFKIMRDGSVPTAEPTINHNSGKEPLDRAAYSSVRASNPFEPLPSAYSAPYIELRYTYLYNITPEEYFRH